MLLALRVLDESAPVDNRDRIGWRQGDLLARLKSAVAARGPDPASKRSATAADLPSPSRSDSPAPAVAGPSVPVAGPSRTRNGALRLRKRARRHGEPEVAADGTEPDTAVASLFDEHALKRMNELARRVNAGSLAPTRPTLRDHRGNSSSVVEGTAASRTRQATSAKASTSAMRASVSAPEFVVPHVPRSMSVIPRTDCPSPSPKSRVQPSVPLPLVVDETSAVEPVEPEPVEAPAREAAPVEAIAVVAEAVETVAVVAETEAAPVEEPDSEPDLFDDSLDLPLSQLDEAAIRHLSQQQRAPSSSASADVSGNDTADTSIMSDLGAVLKLEPQPPVPQPAPSPPRPATRSRKPATPVPVAVAPAAPRSRPPSGAPLAVSPVVGGDQSGDSSPMPLSASQRLTRASLGSNRLRGGVATAAEVSKLRRPFKAMVPKAAPKAVAAKPVVPVPDLLDGIDFGGLDDF